MRKVLSALAVLSMMIVFTAAPAGAAAGDWYNFGGAFEAWNYNDAIDTTSFKLQCTNENNITSGNYDTEAFVDQVLGGATSMSAWGGNLYAPPASVTSAEVQYDETTAPHGFNPDNFWWYVTGQGDMNPAGNISQVLAFEAPSAGTWVRIAVSFEGGIAEENQAEAGTDGVTWTVMLNDTVLHTENTGNAYSSDLFITEDHVFADGDMVYIVVDGNEFQEYDKAKVKVYIAIWDDGSSYWGEFNWGNGRIAGEALVEGGVDGFLPMSSDLTHQGSNFDVTTLRDCVWSNEGDTATAWTWWGSSYFLPDPAESDGGTKDSWWAVLGEDGRLIPEGLTVAALKWTAPETGVYNLYTTVTAGQLLTYYGGDEIDGNAVYVYNGNNQLFYTDASGLQDDYYFEAKDLALNEGDVLYFISDPKVYSDNLDTTQWIIDIETVSVAPDPTATVAPTATAAPTSAEAPQTGEPVIPYAVFAVFSLIAVSLIFARKNLSDKN